MPAQAVSVLVEFLARPGEVISRKQIARILWPDGGDTESEQGINNIIRRLRVALRDTSPDEPIYIETVPKRGYRFIAPVSAVKGSEAPVAQSIECFSGEADAVEPLVKVSDSASIDTEPLETHGDMDRSLEPPRARQHFSIRTVALSVLCLALIAALAWRHWHRPAGSPGQPIFLAIAPFDVTGPESGSGQLAESFRLDLIDGLSQLPGISVRAAHSTIGKSSDAAAHSGLQTLDVAAILYTRFSQTGDLCVLDIEMVRNSDSAHLQVWHYTGTVAQLREIRDQIKVDIFSYWKGSGTKQRAQAGGTADSAAYEHYLRARYFVRQRDAISMGKANEEFQAAIARDPKFAEAYSGMATVWFLMADSEESFANAKRLAMKSIELAPDIAEAHAVLGFVYFRHDWRFADGVLEMRRAVLLDPHEASHHIWLATMLEDLGDFTESEREIDLAKRDDPSWVIVYMGEVKFFELTHQIDRMRKAAETVAALQPEWSNSYEALAWSDWDSGRYPQAIANWRRAAAIVADSDGVALEDRGLKIYNESGLKGYLRFRMERAQAVADKEPHGYAEAADWAALAGDRAACLHDLEQMVRSHDSHTPGIGVDPALDPVHREPEFIALLHRIGLRVYDDASAARATLPVATPY
jgi:DNA-binding winged helix-turn-helix (wHTH) protein/TolB-like protein